MDKNTLSHTTWECKYHIVFAILLFILGVMVAIEGLRKLFEGKKTAEA